VTEVFFYALFRINFNIGCWRYGRNQFHSRPSMPQRSIFVLFVLFSHLDYLQKTPARLVLLHRRSHDPLAPCAVGSCGFIAARTRSLLTVTAMIASEMCRRNSNLPAGQVFCARNEFICVIHCCDSALISRALPWEEFN
jgi:hypothetical protein